MNVTAIREKGTKNVREREREREKEKCGTTPVESRMSKVSLTSSRMSPTRVGNYSSRERDTLARERREM